MVTLGLGLGIILAGIAESDFFGVAEDSEDLVAAVLAGDVGEGEIVTIAVAAAGVKGFLAGRTVLVIRVRTGNFLTEKEPAE